ncbi:MAG: Uma2 family endonuclease [Bacteroidota bacterium]
MITDFDQLDLNKRYTYADYLTWQFDEMVELIRGKVFRRSPAPNRHHQEISSNLHGLIWSYLHGKPCRIFAAPFDVRLPLPPKKQKGEKIDTVVQPDISVICDPSKLDNQGCNGAPDWIIEILSPATSSKDLTEKFDIYQNAGVQEYWVVFPFEQTITVYILGKNGKYQILRTNPFVKGEKITVGIFSDFAVELEEVFVGI